MDYDKLIGSDRITRRQAFASLGAASLSFLAAHRVQSHAQGLDSASAAHLIATPEATEGPFFVDERLNRSDLTSDTDHPSVTEGIPLGLRVSVYEIEGSTEYPIEGAVVDLWHCDAQGRYSDIRREGTEGETFLRGFQITDDEGKVSFRTIYPGWYRGRAIHIHFKVRRYDENRNLTYEFTSQFFFEDDLSDQVMEKAPYDTRGKRGTRNSQDGIYNSIAEDGSTIGRTLTLDLRESGQGYTANFKIAFDSEPDEKSEGQAPYSEDLSTILRFWKKR